ncbi:MAG TPA: hypothetical protein QF455_00550, partial [Phycisphaerales bacterium]|nr:hypothetical protein [Phycisphaerales bacterium]
MITFLALIALFLASWCTALERALRNGPRSELTAHLEKTGRNSLRVHLDARIEGAADVMALLACCLQVIFLAVWVTALAGWSPSAVSDWGGRMFAAGISAAPILWLGSSIIAPAIARWAGGSLLQGCLWIIRIAAFVSPLL